MTLRRSILLLLAVASLIALIVLTNRSSLVQPGVAQSSSDKEVDSAVARSTTLPISSSSSPSMDDLTAAQRRNPKVGQIADRPRFVAMASAARRAIGKDDIALQNAQQGLREYRIVFHENPVGTNAQITKTLLGNNARNTRYLPADAHLNSKNELTDRWDQPLFFHQISATNMQVRSAGPDHVMWTNDDQVLP